MVSKFNGCNNKFFEFLSLKEKYSLNTNMDAYAKHPIVFLYSYIKRYLLKHILLLICVIFAVICTLLSQYAIKNLIDIVSKGHIQSNKILVSAFLLTISLIIADNLLWRVGGWISSYIFVYVTGDIRCDLFYYISGHAPSYFIEQQPGMLASRFTAISNAIYIIENTFIWNVLPPCIAVIGSVLIIAFSINLIMALGLFITSITLAFILYYLAKFGKKYHYKFAAKASIVDGELFDIISNMNLVRTFGTILKEKQRFVTKVHNEVLSRTDSILFLEKLRLLHALITVLLSAILLGWVLILWKYGQATSGDIVLVSSLGFTILHGTRDFAVALVDITQHVIRLSEAIEILLQPYSMIDIKNASKLILYKGDICFHNVSFNYPKRESLLSNFSLSIKAGQRVGLIGKSGAGKSTIFALLQRFYDIQAGSITIDNQDIALVTQSSLHTCMTIVPQDISLLHRSIFENIQYSCPESSLEEVLSAAEKANCMDFIKTMPEGFNTIVGNRGIRLSGGQRQRIAIARAILKNAPILLLDEATSALDSESEKLIQQALNCLMLGRTVIAIAHRLSTLKHFDRIIVIDQGNIIGDGPPSIIYKQPGIYRELFIHQVQWINDIL